MSEALEALNHSDVGHLDVLARQKMWAALGPCLEEARQPSHDLAHHARTVLMLECLRRALPVWDEAQARASQPLLDPEVDPRAAIAHIEAWLSGALSDDRLEQETERHQYLSDYLGELYDRHPLAEGVAEAARNALWVARWDLESDYEDDYQEQEDENWPADFFAAWVLSGSAPWQPDPDGEASKKRRVFWRWYVEDLYPKCWSIAYPPS